MCDDRDTLLSGLEKIVVFASSVAHIVRCAAVRHSSNHHRRCRRISSFFFSGLPVLRSIFPFPIRNNESQQQCLPSHPRALPLFINCLVVVVPLSRLLFLCTRPALDCCVVQVPAPASPAALHQAVRFPASHGAPQPGMVKPRSHPPAAEEAVQDTVAIIRLNIVSCRAVLFVLLSLLAVLSRAPDQPPSLKRCGMLP